MKTKKGRISRFSTKTVVLLLLASIVLGIALDLFITQIEKRLYPLEYSEYVEKYSNELGVPQKIIYAVIKTESNFNELAVSSAQAYGLMQLTEETFYDIAAMLGESPSAFDIYSPDVNIRYGTRYLFYLYKIQ